MPALGNARPRGRGRGRGRGGIERLPGGNLPKQGRTPRGPMGVPPKEMPGPAAPRPRPRFGNGNGNGNGGTMAPSGRGRGRGQRGVGAQGKGQGAANGKGIGVGGAALPGPGGRQLAARVSSGKITQEQAQRTMQQRQTLAKAFGKDWREKLSVGGKSFAQVRGGLAKKPGNAKLAALNKKLMANRKAMLEAARKKNAGGKDGEEESEE